MHWGFKVLIGVGVGAFILYEWNEVTKKHKKRQLQKAQQLLAEAEKVHNPAQQEFLLQEALKIYEASLPADDLHLGAIYSNLAQVSLLMDKVEEARLNAQKALPIFRQKLGSEHPRVADLLVVLASCDSVLGNNEKAKQYCEEAVSIFEKNSDEKDTRRFFAALRLQAKILMLLKEYDVAFSSLNRWERLMQKVLERPNVDAQSQLVAVKHLIDIKLLSSRIFADQARFEEAEHFLRDAIQLIEQRLGPTNTNKVFVLLEYANLLQERKDLEGAEAKYREAIALAYEIASSGTSKASSSPAGGDLSTVYVAKCRLAHFFFQTQRETEGRTILEELKGMKVLPSPTVSNYLLTQTYGIGFVLSGEQERLRPFYYITLSATQSLPKGSTLVAHFEDPSTGERISVKPIQYTGQQSIEFRSGWIQGAKRGRVYEMLVEVYADATLTQRLGVHYQFCPSTYDTDQVQRQEDLLNQLPREEMVALLARMTGQDPAQIEAALAAELGHGEGALGGERMAVGRAGGPAHVARNQRRLAH